MVWVERGHSETKKTNDISSVAYLVREDKQITYMSSGELSSTCDDAEINYFSIVRGHRWPSMFSASFFAIRRCSRTPSLCAGHHGPTQHSGTCNFLFRHKRRLHTYLCRKICRLCTPDKATARAATSRDSGFPVAARFRARPRLPKRARPSVSSARAPCNDGNARRKKIAEGREGQGITRHVIFTRQIDGYNHEMTSKMLQKVVK